MVYFNKMLKNCILLCLLVFILGSLNVSSSGCIDSVSHNSNTEILIDNDYDYISDSGIIDNQEQNLGRYKSKLLKKFKTANQFVVSNHIVQIQVQNTISFFFINYYSPLFNNLPPPITG